MQYLFKKLSLALLVISSAGASVAQAAADSDAIGKNDSFYGVIGLASVTQMDCLGANMGIWRTPLNAVNSGSITVNSTTNAATALSSVTKSGLSSLTQASDSVPGTGTCILSGLVAPNPADYGADLTGGSGTFVPGNSTKVVNPLAQRSPATGSGVAGMTLVMSLVNATPALAVNGNDLIWRINGIATFANTTVGTTTNYGGYRTSTLTTVTVRAAL